MIGHFANLFFMSNLLSFGMGLQAQPLFNSGGTSLLNQNIKGTSK